MDDEAAIEWLLENPTLVEEPKDVLMELAERIDALMEHARMTDRAMDALAQKIGRQARKCANPFCDNGMTRPDTALGRPPATAVCPDCEGTGEVFIKEDDTGPCPSWTPRTSEEPTEHLSVEWSTATSEATEGGQGASNSVEDPTTHYMQATDRMRVRAERAEARVSELERALAEAREALESIRTYAANFGGAGVLQNAYSTIYHIADRALARPRSTEGWE